MSEHQSHESDRAAAYRGLILGAIVLGIVLVTIVRLTNSHYAKAEGAKSALVSPSGVGVWAIDA